MTDLSTNKRTSLNLACVLRGKDATRDFVHSFKLPETFANHRVVLPCMYFFYFSVDNLNHNR